MSVLASINRNGLPPAADSCRCILPAARWVQLQTALQLTDRELQVVQQLFEGRDERQIGAALGISEHTIHTHLGRIFRKLGIRSVRGLVLRVFAAYVDAEQAVEASRAPS